MATVHPVSTHELVVELGQTCTNQDALIRAPSHEFSSQAEPGPAAVVSARTKKPAKNFSASGRWPPTCRCSPEALVAPRSSPSHRFVDVPTGVGIYQSFGFSVGLFVEAQRHTVLHQQMGARPFCCCIAIGGWVLCPQVSLRMGTIHPGLHTLVLEDLVQLGVSPGLNVPVGGVNGLIIQQGTCEDRQVCTSMSALDAVDQHIVSVP